MACLGFEIERPELDIALGPVDRSVVPPRSGLHLQWPAALEQHVIAGNGEFATQQTAWNGGVGIEQRQVLTYSTFVWLGVVQDGCGVDSWPGTGPNGWLYGSNDALVNNHTDRYERFLGAGEWQGIGHTVTMVVDMELRQVWFGPNNSELRLGFSHLPAHVYPTVSLQAGAAVEAWYC
ncbi:MAG: hypothetical protein WDW36_007081 [Sanguina aurantia]